MWNKDCLEVSNLHEGNGFILVEGNWREEGCCISIANIYSPCDLLQKRRVWEELVQMKSNSNSNFGALLMILIASGGKTKGKGQLKLVVEGVREGNSTNSLPIWE